MEEKVRTIAACGLDCTNCDIREATRNPKLAQSIADWFKDELGEVVHVEDVHCAGCWGERAQHWSADCWILQCCVDRKRLAFCYQCEVFPCQRLGIWAQGSERYTKALERLRHLKEEA